MLRTRKSAQIRPKFRDKDLSSTLANPRHRVEQFNRRDVLLEPTLDFCTHPLHRLLKIVQMAQLFTEHESMVREEPANDGLLQQLALGPQPTACQFCEGCRIGFTGEERFQDSASRGTTNICH